MTEKDNQRKCILSSPQENEFWTVRGYRRVYKEGASLGEKELKFVEEQLDGEQ